MPAPRLLVATTNKGKQREYRELLRGLSAERMPVRGFCCCISPGGASQFISAPEGCVYGLERGDSWREVALGGGGGA